MSDGSTFGVRSARYPVGLFSLVGIIEIFEESQLFLVVLVRPQAFS
jgi:hypothetical protein